MSLFIQEDTEKKGKKTDFREGKMIEFTVPRHVDFRENPHGAEMPLPMAWTSGMATSLIGSTMAICVP